MARAKREPGVKPLLVYDNASAHRNAEVKREIRKHFVPMPITRYTPRFNSIERLWAPIKRLYRKKITKLALRRDYDREQSRCLLELICREQVPQKEVESYLGYNKAAVL